MDRSHGKLTSTELAAGVVLIVTTLTFVLSFAILTFGFGWPGNLQFPAEKNFREVVIPKATESGLGYTLYGLYSFMIAPLVSLVVDALRDGEQSSLLECARGYGILSTICRTMGLWRWVLAMPGLAKVYMVQNQKEEVKQAVEAIYDMLNSFMGGIGEGLGVAFFCSMFILFISIWVVKENVASNGQFRWPAWFGYLGLVVSFFVFLPVVEMYGVDMGPMLIIAVVFNLIWFITAAVVILSPLKCQRRGQRRVETNVAEQELVGQPGH